MADLETLVARLHQIHGEIAQLQTFPPSDELYGRLSGAMQELKEHVQKAQSDLDQEIQSMVADLHRKAAHHEQQAAEVAAAAKAPPLAPLAPWEDHQGLAREQMQGLADTLIRLGHQPMPGAGHGRG